jgi:hypothetical protein
MTARKPKHAGLDAQRCLEAAERADLIPSAATLRDQARHVLKLKLGRLVEDRKQLDGARLSEIARALDVTERAYSGSTSPADDARGFVDRLEFIAAVQRELVKRSESRQVEMVESHELEAHPLENKGDSEPASDNMDQRRIAHGGTPPRTPRPLFYRTLATIFLKNSICVQPTLRRFHRGCTASFDHR